jgi:hypothetical protein
VTFQGATLKRHGLRCAVAIVKRDAVKDDAEADRLIALLQDKVFHRNSPVVLMAHDPPLGAVYYGRADLVRCLERVDVTTIPWAEYTFATMEERAAFPGPQPANNVKQVTLR